jgi:exosortase
MRMTRHATGWGILALAGLLGYLYWSVMADLATQWAVDTTFGYGYYIPGVAAYLAWDRRAALRLAPPGSSWWGYLILLVGLTTLVLGRAGGIQLATRGSLIAVLVGLALFLGGWTRARILAFPIAFLALMIPPPARLVEHLTWPLQLFTARFSTEVLRQLGYPVLLQGIYIDLPTVRLEVAEACSGFRSIIALGATGVLLAYMTQRRWTHRVLVVAAVVPIAMLANAIRVTLNIAMGIYEGTFHTVSGWMVFVIATLLLLSLATVLGRLPGTGTREMRRAGA